MADQMLAAASEQSVVLRLGNVRPMAAGVASIPIVSFFPVAGFVNPAYGGRKPATKIEWSALQVTPEELAAVAAIPNAFVDDAGFPIWDEVRTIFSGAIARALDEAVLFGTGAPATYPDLDTTTAGKQGLVPIVPVAATGANALEALSNAAGDVEASGAVPNGIVSGPSIGKVFRNWILGQGADTTAPPTLTVFGWPIVQTPIWDATYTARGDALVGDFTYLLVGLRQDVTFEQSDSAIIQDGTGAIIANAFQEDLTAFRIYMRVGVVVGQPISPDTGAAIAPFRTANFP
jgi:HK97 family phage major capsid protein